MRRWQLRETWWVITNILDRKEYVGFSNNQKQHMHRYQGKVNKFQCGWHPVLVRDESRGEMYESETTWWFLCENESALCFEDEIGSVEVC